MFWYFFGGDRVFLTLALFFLPFFRALPPSSELLVLTPTVKRNLEAVVLALSQRCPVLLEGPIGSGKSSLIQELAYTTGNLDLLFIHLDDQMDSKTLLGNYACTEIPGEFKWQPGALTQAVVRGMWVVFEDIDRAPFEIFRLLFHCLRIESYTYQDVERWYQPPTIFGFSQPLPGPGTVVLSQGGRRKCWAISGGK